MLKLISAKCPNCGANLKLSKQDEIINCEYCHQNVIVEEAIACYKLKITGLISVDGIQTNSELISSANELLKMKEYLKAKRKFLEFTEKNPKDYQGWLGLLICRTRNFRIRDDNNLFENDIYKYYQHYMETAPNDIKEKYKEQLEYYFKQIEDNSLATMKKNTVIKIDPKYKPYIIPFILILISYIMLGNLIFLGGLSYLFVGIIQIPEVKEKNKKLKELSKIISIIFIILGSIFCALRI